MKVHPDLANDFKPVVYQENSLLDLINKNPHLKYIYAPDSFVLEVGGERYSLQSQLLKNCREITQIFEGFDVFARVEEAKAQYERGVALKCKNCGSNIDAFQTSCPNCGTRQNYLQEWYLV